jgi:hypothetical protein
MAGTQIQRRGVATLLPMRANAIDRQKSSKVGTYKNEVTKEVARKYPDRLITPADLSKIHYGRRNKDRENYIRRRLWQTYTELQNEGELWYPVYDTKGHGTLLSIKRYVGDDLDATAFDFYLDRARRRKEITEEHYGKLSALRQEIDQFSIW